jgi:hypothetical protein
MRETKKRKIVSRKTKRKTKRKRRDMRWGERGDKNTKVKTRKKRLLCKMLIHSQS